MNELYHDVIREQRFDTGTVTINYAEGPANGPPFVILHGGAGSWNYAGRLIDALRDRWHLFVPDARGHGLSGHTPGHYGISDYAADVVALLHDVVREPAVVYGHSLGGFTAIAAAAERPDLFLALIDADAPFSNDHYGEDPHDREQNTLWQRLSGRPVDEIEVALRDMPVYPPGSDTPRRAEDVFGSDSRWFAVQALRLHRLDPGMLATVLAGPEVAAVGYVPEILLPKITCPVLILQADPAFGSAIPDADLARALWLLPAATHVRVTGISHDLHGTHTPQVVAAMMPFLERVRAMHATAP